MGRRSITDFSLYKIRYVIGYTILAIILLAVLMFVGLYSPGGVSQQELDSVVKSNTINTLNFGSLDVINLPYHLLQLGFIGIFGLTVFSIKLASLTLALLSIIGLFLLLGRWFSRNVSVLASLIAITTSQFLFIAQDGTSGIMFLFWSVWLLLLASLIARRGKFKKLYKIIFFMFAALSLYTPFSVYILAAMGSAVLLHPHLRYIVRQLSKPVLVIGAILAAIVVAPLVMAIAKDPDIVKTLLGMPTSNVDIVVNLKLIVSEYLDFSKPGSSNILTPFFGLGSMIIVFVGFISTLKNRATAKSYGILAWIVLLMPIVTINPDYISITFLPIVLLLASGIEAILKYWYGLFPLNPYARIVGLLPIIALVSTLVLSGIDRNMNGYRYDPDIANRYSIDLKILPTDTKNLVVSEYEIRLYQILQQYNPDMQVSTTPQSDTFLATRNARRFDGYEIEKILTDSSSTDSDRFYLYKKIDK